MKHLEEEKITQWFINNVNGTPSEEQLALRKVYEQRQEIERLKLELSDYRQAILQDKEMLGLKQENERLNNIIEEVRKML